MWALTVAQSMGNSTMTSMKPSSYICVLKVLKAIKITVLMNKDMTLLSNLLIGNKKIIKMKYD